MTSSEIRALSTEEITSKLDDAREELFKLRFQFSTGQLKDFTRMRATRRSIARLATVLRERAIAGQIAAQSAAKES
jgi:large subunit ribosomal protein L29